MIAVISPAKTLNFEAGVRNKKSSVPDHLDKTELLIKKLRGLSKRKICELMDISDNLAELNAERYQDWEIQKLKEEGKPAIAVFKGDVYLGMQADKFNSKDLDYAQEHLLILSGLHGYLRPLDFILPYRLEMGTSISIGKHKNLYSYWGDEISPYLNSKLEGHKEKVLLNLASDEYFKAIRSSRLQYPVQHVEFKDKKNGQYKMISFFAKKARGTMAAYIIRNRIDKLEDLKEFKTGGYRFNPELSKGNTWTFTRDMEELIL